MTSQAIKELPEQRIAAYDWFYEQSTDKQKEQLNRWVEKLRGDMHAPFGEKSAKELIVALLTSEDVRLRIERRE